MNREEVIEIARMAGTVYATETWTTALSANQLEAFANEVERRTLERAAVVCESSPSYDWHKFACEAAAAIRALKESK